MTFYPWGFPRRRVGLKLITHLSWARHAYSHYATNPAYQSFDTHPYSHFIDEELRTRANDLSDAAALL